MMPRYSKCCLLENCTNASRPTPTPTPSPIYLFLPLQAAILGPKNEEKKKQPIVWKNIIELIYMGICVAYITRNTSTEYM